jgi:hypothetical protein
MRLYIYRSPVAHRLAVSPVDFESKAIDLGGTFVDSHAAINFRYWNDYFENDVAMMTMLICCCEERSRRSGGKKRRCLCPSWNSLSIVFTKPLMVVAFVRNFYILLLDGLVCSGGLFYGTVVEKKMPLVYSYIILGTISCP